MRTSTLFTGLVLCFAAIADTPPTPAMVANFSSPPAGFEENKGQVRTSAGDAAPFVRYRLTQGNTQLFLLNDGIAYQFSRLHYPAGYQELMANHDPEKRLALDAMRDQIRQETFRMDMTLEGADPATRITTEGRSSDYTQYYNHVALDVHTYSKVTYHDVYPGIDWVVYTTEKGMKYDFVVRPGADPNTIKLRFAHHEELAMNSEGGLVLGNRLGEITEAPPVSHQQGAVIATRFVLEGNELGFDLEGYDHSKELVIDPELAWATYYGGQAISNDRIDDVVVDGTGAVVIVGETTSTSGIAQGGYQNTLGGGMWDGFIAKFNSDGVRLWASYYGGEDVDGATSCALDPQGNIIFAGITSSQTNIAYNGHQSSFTGTQTHFLVKMDTSGGLIWATYYGNADSQSSNEAGCVTDADGNIYLAGYTHPGTGHATPGSYQPDHNGGVDDAFVAKFSPAGTRLWGTYYGGEGDELGPFIGLAVDPSGGVYLGGSTRSTTGIASGGHQNAFGGGSRDAFLVKFTNTGDRLWGTYYGDTGFDDFGSCATDGEGNVYLAGGTGSTAGIAWQGFQNTPASTGSGFADDAFLVKFNSAGERSWGTYFGGELPDRETGCTTDTFGNVYISGITVSTTGIAFEGHQPVLSGLSDAYLVRFDATGARTWATYYGGPGHEEDNSGGGIATGTNVRVCLVGWTDSQSGIAYNGHQNIMNGAATGYLAVFDGDGPALGTVPLTGPVCTGSPVDVPFTATSPFNPGNIFTAQLSDATGSFANPVDIGSLSGTTSGTIEATIPGGTSMGTGYRIRVVASDPATEGDDNGADLEITTPGAPCDDGEPDTNGDVINGDCVCAGAPPCSASADLQESEPNDDTSTANALAANTSIGGSLGSCTAASDNTDHFVISPTTAGVLRLEVCLSSDGNTPINVRYQVIISTGFVIGSYEVPAGLNNVPTTHVIEFPCLGLTTYYIIVDAPGLSDCLDHSLSYTMLAPAFGNDPFPNDGVAYDTYQDGQNGFFAEATSSDLFRITAPMDGRLNMEVQAERSGSVPGTLLVRLYTTTSYVIKEWVVPSGANGVPDTILISADCLAEGASYDVYFLAQDCGTSYRWKYTMTPPVFAGDSEPNNSTGDAIVVPASTPGTGHIDFLPQLEGTGDNVDLVRMDLPSDGVLHVNVEAEHADTAADGTVQVVVMRSTGAILATWQAAVGGGSTPANTNFDLTCMDTTIPYYLELSSSTCGVSYSVTWNVSPPFYATDPEPNDYYEIGIPMDQSNTWYDGHLGFHNASDDDHYRFSHPGGAFSVTVSAEHVGADEGTMELSVMQSTGTIFGTFVVPVGGSSTPLTNTFTIADLPAGENYALYLRDVTCGVSYRIHCANDADNDGICDVADLCPGGPEPGTPCDDGNTGTVNDVINADCDCEGDLTTGVSATAADGDELRIWPNPATDEVWVDIGGASAAPATVIVRDLQGRTITMLGPIAANGSGQYVVQLGAVAQGTYILDLHVGGKRWSRRIMKS